jgi:hypothetical protein
MKELIEYREKLLNRLSEAAKEFQTACMAVKDPHAKVDENWTVHQVASHARDVEKMVYGARAQQTLKEDVPLFQNFDPDEWMEIHYDRNEPLEKILNEFVSDINSLCEMLKSVPRSAWSRESSHATIGDGLTVQLWVERGLAHIEEHLAGVTRK